MANSDLVVSTETGGLGNRLKSWVSSMRLGADARVHWPVTKNMPAAFGELFANDCAVDAVPAGRGVYGSWRLAILPQDEAHLPAGFATVGAGAHPIVRGLGKAWWTPDRASAPIAIASWCFRSSIRAVRRAPMRGTSTSSTSAYRSTFASALRRAVPADRRAAGDRGRRERVGRGESRRRRRRRASANVARRCAAAPQVSRAVAAPADAAARLGAERAVSRRQRQRRRRADAGRALRRAARARLSAHDAARRQLARRRSASRRISSTCCCWRARSDCSRAT